MRNSRAQIYDELLVIKCQQGNKGAFDELVGRWQKRLWHYAFKVTGSEPAAWDIVQETWYEVLAGPVKKDELQRGQWCLVRRYRVRINSLNQAGQLGQAIYFPGAFWDIFSGTG